MRFSLALRLLGWFLVGCCTLLPAAAIAGSNTGEANIFIYHRFGDARYPSTNISLEVFAEQLAWLKAQGRPVLPLGEVVHRLAAGEPLPEGCVVLTVDDAFRSFLESGMPLLRRYHFPVTLFVNTNAVGAPGYLTWDELRTLAAEGVEIENHSATHDYLLEHRRGEGGAAWRKRVKADIVRAQRVLSRELGRSPRLFAYPFGEFSPELEALVRQEGFEGAVGQQSGVVWGGSDRFAIPRFPMGGPYATLAGFRAKAGMRALRVQVLKPSSPVLAGQPDGPPQLRLRIDGTGIEKSGLSCFVQGENNCRVDAVAGAPEEVLVTAEKPLSGRRNKYTVTAPGVGGKWYWFSQPWFQPRRPGNGD